MDTDCCLEIIKTIMSCFILVLFYYGLNYILTSIKEEE